MHIRSCFTPGRALLALLPAVSAAAQCPESGGAFVGMAFTGTVHDSAAFDAGQVYLKRTGFTSQPPAVWPAASLPASRPDFDLRPMLTQCQSVPVRLEIDAMSIGEDWVIGDDCSGVAKMPAGRWASVAFSLRRGASGARGSAIETETMGNGAQSDVFDYVIPGSVMPPALVGLTTRVVDAAEAGLSDRKAELSSLDAYVPFYLLDDRIGNPSSATPPGMMPPALTLFFSLTSASAAAAPASWFGAAGPSGASILQAVWDGRKRTWSCPTLWRSYKDLGLAAHEDIDALAVDLGQQRMLFSTDIRVVARDPILFYAWGGPCDATTVPYTEPGGDPVSKRIGLIGIDDVDAICAMDPSALRRPRQAGARPNAMLYAFGTPAKPTGLLPPPVLSASTFHGYDFAAGQLQLGAYLVGWPGGAPRQGLAGLMLTPPGALLPNIPLPAQMRDLAAAFCGDPRAEVIAVPPNPTLYGQSIAARWFASEGGRLFEAYPILITL